MGCESNVEEPLNQLVFTESFICIFEVTAYGIADKSKI